MVSSFFVDSLVFSVRKYIYNEVTKMKYALTNMYLLDGTKDMKIKEGKAVLVEDGVILDIVDSSAIPSGYEIKDLNGGYLMPGLINLHVHIPGSGKPANPSSNKNAMLVKLLKFGIVRFVVGKMCASYARQQLLSGTTTIRAVGGVEDLDSKLRDKINSGKVVGPRILAANYAVSVPGGHMTGTVAKPAHSSEEAAAMVRDLVKTNPDLIKLMITGGVLDAKVPGEPGDLKMPPEYVKAACDEAHKNGLKVAAHVEGSEGLKVALENGVDTIEHGGKPSPEVIELFKQKGAALVATISPAVPFQVLTEPAYGVDEVGLINGKALYANMLECIKECLANDIPVGLGTDTGCPFTTHYDTWRELYYFSKCCNLSKEFAIYTATLRNAEIVGIDKFTGSLEKGKYADFVVVKDNPLKDFKTLRTPVMVALKGKIIENPKPKRIPEVDEALDKMYELM